MNQQRSSTAGPARLLASALALVLVALACGDAQDAAPPSDDTGASTSASAATREATPSPARPGDLDGLGDRAERAFAAMDESEATVRGQVGGPIEIPIGLPRDLPLPVDATPLEGDAGDADSGVLVLSVDHPVDRTRGFFRAALRGRGFEILSDERSESGFELHARRPSHELFITGESANDATRVSIAPPRG